MSELIFERNIVKEVIIDQDLMKSFYVQCNDCESINKLNWNDLSVNDIIINDREVREINYVCASDRCKKVQTFKNFSYQLNDEGKELKPDYYDNGKYKDPILRDILMNEKLILEAIPQYIDYLEMKIKEYNKKANQSYSIFSDKNNYYHYLSLCQKLFQYRDSLVIRRLRSEKTEGIEAIRQEEHAIMDLTLSYEYIKERRIFEHFYRLLRKKN